MSKPRDNWVFISTSPHLNHQMNKCISKKVHCSLMNLAADCDQAKTLHLWPWLSSFIKDSSAASVEGVPVIQKQKLVWFHSNTLQRFTEVKDKIQPFQLPSWAPVPNSIPAPALKPATFPSCHSFSECPLPLKQLLLPELPQLRSLVSTSHRDMPGQLWSAYVLVLFTCQKHAGCLSGLDQTAGHNY